MSKAKAILRDTSLMSLPVLWVSYTDRAKLMREKNGTAKPLKYRWVNMGGKRDPDGEMFQIKIGGRWYDANSIDFDFRDKKGKLVTPDDIIDNEKYTLAPEKQREVVPADPMHEKLLEIVEESDSPMLLKNMTTSQERVRQRAKQPNKCVVEFRRAYDEFRKTYEAYVIK